MIRTDMCQGNFWTNYVILEYAFKGSVQQNIDPTHYSGYTLEMYKEDLNDTAQPERT